MRRNGPFPAACLGVGEAKAREIREARAKNLDIIRDSGCGQRSEEVEGTWHTLYTARGPTRRSCTCARSIRLQRLVPHLPARAARGAETPSVRIVLIISLPAHTRHRRVIAPVRLARSDYTSPCRQSVAKLKQTAVSRTSPPSQHCP